MCCFPKVCKRRHYCQIVFVISVNFYNLLIINGFFHVALQLLSRVQLWMKCTHRWRRWLRSSLVLTSGLPQKSDSELKDAHRITKITLSTHPTPLIFYYQPAYYLALFVSYKRIIKHAFTQAHNVEGGWDYLGLQLPEMGGAKVCPGSLLVDLLTVLFLNV